MEKLRQRPWLMLLAVAVAVVVLVLLASCSGYQTACYFTDGGNKIVCGSGGEVEFQSGATVDVQSGAAFSVASGQTNTNWFVVSAPTAIATATPAVVINSLGVSNLFEVRDAATPVFAINNGGTANLLGNQLTLDADRNTSLSGGTDNTIDVIINAASDFQFTANTFTVLAGSKVTAQNATNAGMVFAAYNTLAYTNTTNKTMFVIPANADIVDIMFVVSTAFDDTGTDVVACGTTGDDPDEYVDDLDVSSAGLSRMGDLAGMVIANGDVGSSDITVLCKYTGQNGDSSAGAANLTILYRID